ncbi:MAG: VWA domain-containing protein, partial [Phycisphaerae bacterium]|nr:VWA domain-containing protein [Phycisphaerae bacterium]
MQWLTPLTGLYAAAVTVPILLLMYFLKLKRQERIISSTLLWKRAIQDLQVNAPFQKMRRNILLLLQILILAALLLSLAGPIASMTGGPGKRHVLLIDRSASMNATDVDDSRLAQAKEQATLYVESLRDKNAFSLQDNSDQAMIITFDDHSKVLCNFTSDKRQLIEAIKQITPGEGKSTLSEAVMVARAFAQSPGEETNSRSAQSAAQLVLFSDGRIDDIGKLESGSEDLLFQKIGQSGENIAITAMQARRSYENPEEVTLFATLANYGDTDQKCQLQLSINNNVYAVKPVTIPARLMTDNPTDTPDDNAKTIEKPGELAVNYDLTHNEGGVLEMRLLSDDLLACDNAAWAVLAPPKRLSVLLVTEGNVVLKTVLQACPIAKLAECTPDEFENAEHSEGAVFYNQHPYDIIILDDCVPVKPSSKLPRCRYLVFGRPPDGIDITVKEDLESQVIID